MRKDSAFPYRRSVFVFMLLTSAMCFHTAADEKMVIEAPAELTITDEEMSIEGSSIELTLIDENLDLNFSGGSVADFMESVKTILPDLNIVVADYEALRSVWVPPMYMKAVDCRQLAACLEDISGIKCKFPGPNTMLILCSKSPDDNPTPVYQRFDLHFENGGTVNQLLGVIQEAVPNLNILVTEGEELMDGAIVVPPLSLKQTNFDELWDVFYKFVYGIENEYMTDNTVFIACYDPTVEITPAESKPRKDLFIYPMAPLLESYSLADIMALIYQTCDVMEVQPPKFQIHDETSMLIASVTPKQSEIMQRILSSLSTQ